MFGLMLWRWGTGRDRWGQVMHMLMIFLFYGNLPELQNYEQSRPKLLYNPCFIFLFGSLQWSVG